MPESERRALTADELAQLSTDLAVLEEWLREYPGRHADDMADVVDRAWGVIDDLADKARAEETRQNPGP